MLRVLFRLLLAAGGAALAALLVAMLEARAVVRAMLESGGGAPPAMATLLFAEIGVLLPIVLVIGLGAGATSIVLEPGVPKSPGEHLADLRGGPVIDRLRAAAVAPLLIFAAFAWCVASAHAARAALAHGGPADAGLTIGAASVGLVVLALAAAVALLPVVRRALALASGAAPQLLDPAVTGGAALVVVLALFAFGIVTGDTGGGGGVLGIFGVLKRAELDLRPVANALLVAGGAYAAQVAFGGARFAGARGAVDAGPALSSVAALGLLLLLGGLCVRASSVLEAEPLVTRGIEKQAPLGKIALVLLRRATDRDGDGYSGRFGGGDCNDRDARMNPGSRDAPGNGVDEDCSGADTPAPPAIAARPPAIAAKQARPGRTYNVLLITIDTLRVDLGFMGYDRPISPNLDKLAEKSAVFERAYSMASYTGKSIGPMFIGKYPSETFRDGGHFNTYFPSNTLVTERLHDRGVRTFAAHCHWYFRFPTGLNQGMDVWDVSAIPAGMGDNDTTVTSDRETEVALKLLAKPENVTPAAEPIEIYAGDAGDAAVVTFDPEDSPRRFFGWLHYVDPHAQYVPHEGAPELKGSYPAKDLYDGEVWYTDKYVGKVLDYIAEQPWAADTAIIVTADHGEAFGDHAMSWHGAEIWESLVRVPLVVHVPGAAPKRIKEKRSHIDMARTILDLMGVPAPEDEDEMRGTSLLPEILSESTEHPERDVYIDMPPGPYNGLRRAVITGPTPGMKLIHQGGSVYQLFDLAEDPGEKKDLASDKDELGLAIERMNAIRARLKEIEVKVEPP